MRDDTMTLEATLSHAAARLYIHLLWRGDGFAPKAVLMRGAGIRDYRDFDRGWAELVNKGLLDAQSRHVWLPSVATTENPVTITEIPVFNTEKPVATTDLCSPQYPVPTTEKSVANTEKPVATTELSVLNTEADIAEADEMDASGDERDPRSPFQQRRQRQIRLLAEAWLLLFPRQQPLQSLAAKQLLIAARSQAATVFQAMQKAAERGADYPLAYTRKLVEELAKKQRESVEREREWGTEREPTPEYLAKLARIEQLAKEHAAEWGWDAEDFEED